MSESKKNKSGRLSLFIIATLTIGLITFLMRPGKGVPAPLVETAVPGHDLPGMPAMLPVLEDSFRVLITQFCLQRTKKQPEISSSGNYLTVRMERYGVPESYIDFYNNPRLFKDSDHGFKISIQNNGGLEIILGRKIIEGARSVLVPADILFRLFKEKI